ncbi:MAG: hypothetical protein NTV34_16260, partial [Proteobacteria bacterium]|nr:hypothetical protein [Pseudomonadota bacterium]
VIETVSGVTALPPRELFMNQLRVDQVMIATYQAKWNEEYRRRWGVQTAKAGPLAESTRRNLIDGSIKIFKALGMNGYARMDWRIDRNGDAVFLESNPNPALAQDDDFAKSAKASGRSYQKLILDLILIALPQREVTIKKDQKL